MKKNLLILIILMVMVGFTQAQVIEDFEVIKMNLMTNGTNDSSSMVVVPNPDKTGINTSNWVVKFVRDKDGFPFGGFWSPLPVRVDVTVNKYVHVKVWKPRISPIKFKLEGGDAGTLETASMTPQTTIGAWEDMVFDFSSKTGTYPIIAFMPDFEEPLTLTEDIIIYFDDIIVNNDPTPNTAAAYVIEDYEFIPLNLMIGDPGLDSSSMIGVPNPVPDALNSSNWVIRFLRDKDGVPWEGFWSGLPTPIDVTTNKYIHAKVWKPRISPIKFKIEGGSGTLEVASMLPQTAVGAWEDMVFDFSTLTGTHPTIAFMPDFEEPVTLLEDIVIYFDDIILNNSADPFTPPEVTMNVDMHGSGLTAGQPVYIAGDFGGIYGTWNEPGSNPENEMKDLDGDSIYSLTMTLPAKEYQFKFFKGAGWAGGEWDGDPNRRVTVTGTASFTYKWGVKPASATFRVDMKGSGLTTGPVSCVGNFGGKYGIWNEPGTNVNDQMTAETPITDSIYTITMVLDSVGTYQFKFFDGIGWATGEWDGDPNRVVIVKGDTTFAIFIWGQKPSGIIESTLAGKVSVYPVPFNNNLTIKTDVELKYIVISSTIGQQFVKLENIGIGTTAINTSKLATGLYFVTFYPKSGTPYTLKSMKY